MSRTTPWLKLTVGCMASAMASVASDAVITAVPTVPERTVPVATPPASVGEAGSVSVAVTLVPRAIVITWPLIVAQDSPGAGTGQFATAGTPPTETPVTVRLT